MRHHQDGGDTYNTPTAHGSHSIAANDIKNVIIKWVMHPSARWLPLLLACAALVLSQAEGTQGPLGQYALWALLAALSLVTAAARVLVRATRGVGVTGALSLVSVLATVGGWLVFQNVRAHGEIDVTGQIRTEGRQPLNATDNRSLVLRLGEDAFREPRNTLRLTLAIKDHDTAGPTCLHHSAAAVSLADAGTAGQEITLGPGRTAELSLGGRTSSVRIQVTLRTVRGCEMDVRAASAVLHDS